MATAVAPAAPAATGGGDGSGSPAAEVSANHSILPPYPEMILAAIKALDDKDGSNKSAIANYIESTYGEDELPPSHASLLTAHLARMKESGELLLMKNNYIIPGPEAPPKRGRGRPPKPKDPLAVAVAKASSGLPRRRGRPPKKAVRPAFAATTGAGGAAAAVPAVPAAAASAGVSPSPAGTAVTGIKRGRGRPPKAKPALTN